MGFHGEAGSADPIGITLRERWCAKESNCSRTDRYHRPIQPTLVVASQSHLKFHIATSDLLALQCLGAYIHAARAGTPAARIPVLHRCRSRGIAETGRLLTPERCLGAGVYGKVHWQ